MDIPSVNSSTSGVATLAAQPLVQPQEQQARNLRTEQERDDATRPDDQVILSDAARQVVAVETDRVVPQTEVSAFADKSQEKDRVEEARQAQIESQRNERPVPRSVARALETYTQTSALSSGNS
jgi:flagellar biosynthesis/type III secretory pathway protein FliH